MPCTPLANPILPTNLIRILACSFGAFFFLVEDLAQRSDVSRGKLGLLGEVDEEGCGCSAEYFGEKTFPFFFYALLAGDGGGVEKLAVELLSCDTFFFH